MSLLGFQARNHPQQATRDEVDDRAIHPEFFAQLDERFHFSIDIAASASNHRLSRYCTPREDALRISWQCENVWCNPPYSDLRPWVQKAWTEYRSGRVPLIVMLVPANRTEQSWWQQEIEPYRDRDLGLTVEFLAGRLRFIEPAYQAVPSLFGGTQAQQRMDSRPPFGCCLLIWERP